MPDSSNNSKRIAKNTLILYFRMLFLMLVSLYTSRVVLDALGIEDYGIYNVVGGFIMMFNMINTALVNANSRFINYEMGKGDEGNLSNVFSTAVSVHIGITLILLLFAETVGLWYVNSIMVLPAERLEAANWCFQLSIFNFCLVLINIPYRACIIAHERMKAFAYVSIIDGLGQLVIAFAVVWNPFDKLIYYALLLFVLQNFIRYLYQSYCRRNFQECHYRFILDNNQMKKMLSFSTWNLVGNGAAAIKTHGGNLILNLFFGPTVNAARGLANHVNSAVASFSTNFLMAIAPQITQSYAKKDYSYMISLMNRGARFSYYLLFVISLPLIVNANYILHIWLKEVPPYTVIFVQLSLVVSILYGMTRPLVTGQNATGNVRDFQLMTGFFEFMNLPICYLVLWLGYSPVSVVVVAIVLEFVAVVARIFMLPMTIPYFKPWIFVKDVLLKCVVVTVLAIIVPVLLAYFFEDTFVSLLLNVLVCIISTVCVVYVIGLYPEEKFYIVSKAKKYIKK